MKNHIVLTYKKNNLQVHEETVTMSLHATEKTLMTIKREGCRSTIYVPNMEGQLWDSVDVKQVDELGVVEFEKKNWITAGNYITDSIKDKVTVEDLQNYVADFKRVNCYEDESVEKRINHLFKQTDRLADAIAQENKEQISKDLYYAMWNLMDIANKLGIDVNEECKKRMEEKYE
ncbi:MazG-like family protein [Bacillus cereus]|uniref:MazG-like family protein n=1 Tax=Bacillus cereus TaxID=1396 RepID=UPI003D177E24